MKSDVEYLVRKTITSISPYISARDTFCGDCYEYFDANEIPYGRYNRYPDSNQTLLKQQVANLRNVDVENVFLGNGSNEIIDLCFRIFCEPYEEKAIIFSPTYGIYDMLAKLNGVELIKLSLTDQFQIDPQTVAPFFQDKSVKLIFICSPNNPTGNTINSEDIDFIIDNFDGIVVIDEAYIDFCIKNSNIRKIKSHTNVIICQTLSKAWGLAGLRVGMAFMNNKTITYFNKAKLPYNIGSVNQEKALANLKNMELYRNHLKVVIAEREKMMKELRKISIVKRIHASQTNFILIEVADSNAVINSLLDKNIVVRNRSYDIENSIRITIGTPSQNRRLVEALKSVCYEN